MTARRPGAAVRSVVDQAVLAKVRDGRLRDDNWPYGLRAVVVVGVALCAVATVLALFAGPIRGWSDLSVPNSLTSSVPDALVWLLVLLLRLPGSADHGVDPRSVVAVGARSAVGRPAARVLVGRDHHDPRRGGGGGGPGAGHGRDPGAAGDPPAPRSGVVGVSAAAGADRPRPDPVPAGVRHLRRLLGFRFRRSSSTRRSACSPSWCSGRLRGRGRGRRDHGGRPS